MSRSIRRGLVLARTANSSQGEKKRERGGGWPQTLASPRPAPTLLLTRLPERLTRTSARQRTQGPVAAARTARQSRTERETSAPARRQQRPGGTGPSAPATRGGEG